MPADRQVPLFVHVALTIGRQLDLRYALARDYYYWCGCDSLLVGGAAVAHNGQQKQS